MIRILIFLLSVHVYAEASYKTSSASCASCKQIEDIVGRHNSNQSPDERLKLTLELANVIKKMSIKGKKPLEQQREIYFAINSSVQVMADDFDSATVIYLMDLRAQAPKQFDYVFWRFPLGEQQKIVERMKAAKHDNVRPEAQIPVPKTVE